MVAEHVERWRFLHGRSVLCSRRGHAATCCQRREQWIGSDGHGTLAPSLAPRDRTTQSTLSLRACNRAVLTEDAMSATRRRSAIPASPAGTLVSKIYVPLLAAP